MGDKILLFRIKFLSWISKFCSKFDTNSRQKLSLFRFSFFLKFRWILARIRKLLRIIHHDGHLHNFFGYFLKIKGPWPMNLKHSRNIYSPILGSKNSNLWPYQPNGRIPSFDAKNPKIKYFFLCKIFPKISKYYWFTYNYNLWFSFPPWVIFTLIGSKRPYLFLYFWLFLYFSL